MEFNAVDDMSAEELKVFASDLKNTRKVDFLPDPLEVVAMKSVIKNHTFFIKQVENPLRFLPNTIVQKFLKMILDTKNTKGRLVSENLEESFVLLLLNPQLIEFTCGLFDFEDTIYFPHLMERCPKLRKINFVAKQELSNFHMPTVPFRDLSRWSNLTTLNMAGYFMTDEAVEKIQENHPKLEELSFALATEKFTMSGVEVLSKMLCLKSVSIQVQDVRSKNATEALVHIAGKVPNLQRYKFFDCQYEELFVDSYGRLYPNKKLALERLSLNSNFNSDWPSCLKVEKLMLNFQNLTAENIDKICSISCPLKDVTFFKPRLAQAYEILDRLGSNITKMTVHELGGENFEYLDIHRLLTPCPKLEEFQLSVCGGLGIGNLNSLTPTHFQNLKSFDCVCFKDDLNLDKLNQIYKMYLIGSDKYNEKLLVPYKQLKTALECFQEFPNKMSKLQEVQFRLYLGNATLNMAMDFIMMLIRHAPYLKKITIKLHSLKDDIRKNYGWFYAFARSVGVDIKFSLYVASCGRSLIF